MNPEILSRSVVEVGEEMLFQELVAAGEGAPAEDVLWAEIEVRSPFRGHLCVALERTAVETLAEVLFGGEVEPEPTTRLDLVAELTNTIAGTFARHVSDVAPLALCPPRSAVGAAPPGLSWLRFRSAEAELFVGSRPHEPGADRPEPERASFRDTPSGGVSTEEPHF